MEASRTQEAETPTKVPVQLWVKWHTIDFTDKQAYDVQPVGLDTDSANIFGYEVRW